MPSWDQGVSSSTDLRSRHRPDIITFSAATDLRQLARPFHLDLPHSAEAWAVFSFHPNKRTKNHTTTITAIGEAEIGLFISRYKHCCFSLRTLWIENRQEITRRPLSAGHAFAGDLTSIAAYHLTTNDPDRRCRKGRGRSFLCMAVRRLPRANWRDDRGCNVDIRQPL